MTTKQQWFSLVSRSLFTLGAFGAAATAFLALEADAQAQSRFGDKNQLAITGENLFTLETARFSEAQVNGDHWETSNRFGFLYTEGKPSPRGPQVGGHFFIIPSLSLGATIGFESRGSSHTDPDNNGVQVTTQNNDESTFLFMPKVGYALMFGQVVGIWFRGGIGYFRVGVSNPTDTRVKSSHSYGLLSVDALLVINPVQHFGFYVGPQADLSITGSRSATNQMGVETSWGASYRSLGLGLGLIGTFDL